jgi:hypothetical protein
MTGLLHSPVNFARFVLTGSFTHSFLIDKSKLTEWLIHSSRVKSFGNCFCVPAYGFPSIASQFALFPHISDEIFEHSVVDFRMPSVITLFVWHRVAWRAISGQIFLKCSRTRWYASCSSSLLRINFRGIYLNHTKSPTFANLKLRQHSFRSVHFLPNICHSKRCILSRPNHR